MWKWIRVVIIYVPYIIYKYFRFLRPMSKHKERYTLEERYTELRKCAIKLMKVLKVDIKAKGNAALQNRKTHFIVMNHYALLDPVLLVCLSEQPIIFVSKIETLKMPFVGRALIMTDGITLDRDNLRSEIASIKEVQKQLEKGNSVVIFPEGTRNKSYNGDLLEFKAGSFKAAMRVGVDIIPVTSVGTQFPLKFSTWKRYPISVQVGKPYLASDYQNKTTVAFSEEVQAKMQEMINEVRILQNERMRPYLKRRHQKYIEN